MTQAESKYNIGSLLLPPGNTPFIFAMPLKPRSACSDWEIVQENLRHTIRSIRGSTVENYMIVIACHDRPDLDMESVRELQLLSAPFSPESNMRRGAQDKARKLRLIGAWLKEHLRDDAAYVMFLDSDDLVHRDLVNHVLRAEDRRCYSIAQGYMYDCRTGVLEFRDRRFFALCGSSFIGWFLKEELPRSWNDLDNPYARFGVYPQRGHQHYPAIATELGKQVDTVPFPAITYMVNHGDNLHTIESGNEFRELHPFHLVWPNHAKNILRTDFSYDDTRTSAKELARIGTFARVMLGSTLRKIERAASGGA
jgi:hypothetical protein